MPNSNTSVAVLLPAWQSAGFMQRTLDCLSAQTHENFRVVVSVDLCDDDTHAICVAHAARDVRFSVCRQQERLGYVGNCNFLLGQAQANYALFAFHDDVLAPDYLKVLGAVLDAKPETILSFSDVHLTQVDGRVEHWEFSALEGVQDRTQRAMIMLRKGSKWWVPNRGLFRLDQARRIRGLKTHAAGEFAADWPWLFHMSLLGQFTRVPQTLCWKYYQPGSLSRGWAYSPRQWLEVMAAIMRELWNSDLSTEEKLRIAGPLGNTMFRIAAGLAAKS